MRRIMIIFMMLLVVVPLWAQEDETFTIIDEGIQIIIHVDEPDLIVDTVLVILERAESLELANVQAQIIGEATIQLQFPGVDRLPRDVIETLTQRGLLEFVDFSGMVGNTPDGLVNTSAQVARGIVDLDAAYQPFTGQPFPTVITGESLENVEVVQDVALNRWNVLFEIRTDDTEMFGTFTERHIGEPLAIVLDGQIISAPIIQERIDSTSLISGNFTMEEATNLAIQLRSGELPTAITIISTDTYQTLGFGN